MIQIGADCYTLVPCSGSRIQQLSIPDKELCLVDAIRSYLGSACRGREAPARVILLKITIDWIFIFAVIPGVFISIRVRRVGCLPPHHIKTQFWSVVIARKVPVVANLVFVVEVIRVGVSAQGISTRVTGVVGRYHLGIITHPVPIRVSGVGP